jgi:hypothetical protein
MMSDEQDPDLQPMPSVAWDIRREGRAWDTGEARARYELTPEKFEMWKGKPFFDDTQRLTLLALLLENVGADQAVRLGDPEVWRAPGPRTAPQYLSVHSRGQVRANAGDRRPFISGVSMPLVRFPIALATLLLATPPLVPTSVAQSSAAPLALTGATIYPSPDLPAIRNGVILLRDGRIAAVGRHGEVTVPRGADTLDCTGLTVTAGFWNSHVHSPATASPAASTPARPCGIPSRSGAGSPPARWRAP